MWCLDLKKSLNRQSPETESNQRIQMYWSQKDISIDGDCRYNILPDPAEIAALASECFIN